MAEGVLLCAVDLGPLTSRVLSHASGFARTFDARLKILHVAAPGRSAEAAVSLRTVSSRIADRAGIDDPIVAVRTGPVSQRILEETLDPGTRFVVMGTRARGSVARLMLGSTSEEVLRAIKVPILLVPPGHRDIVSLSRREVSFTTGKVLAAIDLAEMNRPQLEMASALATAASEPLVLLTIPDDEQGEDEAADELRTRASRANAVSSESVIVRRGSVAEEIAAAAAAEHCGVVVMGLRNAERGVPGLLAANVMHGGRAFVLAVPSDWSSA